jgi:hypothetical protein
MKDKLLKSLDYLYQLQPSKYNTAVITRFKWNLLPDLIMFITKAQDQLPEPTDEENAKTAGLI